MPSWPLIFIWDCREGVAVILLPAVGDGKVKAKR